jgi:hypothetical protein
MKHFLFSFLMLFITLLCGVTVGLQVHKWSTCQALADAKELRAWDIVCEEPLSEKRKPRDKEES